MYVIVQFLACQLLLIGFEAAVQFINEPEDVIINEGGVAMFNCSYSGTTVLPFWFINGIFYPIDRLPSNHSYVGWRLIVRDVQLSDNNTHYQCAFITIRSNIGTLYVIPAKEVFLPTNITQTTNPLHKDKNLTTKDGTVINTTTLITTTTSLPFPKIQDPLVISVIGIICLIVIILFVITLTAMLLFMGRKYKEHHGIDEAQPEDQLSTHIYEEILMEDNKKVEAIQNACYSSITKQPVSTIKNSTHTELEENPAYNIYPHHLHKQIIDNVSHSPATPPANMANHHANLITE